MYTEDDSKVNVKGDDSNIEYSDFYTSFNEIDNNEKTSKKSKKKGTKKTKEEKEEKDYANFYGSNDYSLTDNNYNDGGKVYNKKTIIKIIIAVILLIILIILAVILFSGNSNSNSNKTNGDIELSSNNIVLNIGDKEYVSYKVINTENSVTASFESTDTNVVIVSENGEITAISAGKASIIIHYTIDGTKKTKKCDVEVNSSGNVNQNVNLSLKFNNGGDNKWTNQDVVVAVEASSIFGISSIKYATNCDSNCHYVDVTNNKITISSSGTTKLKVQAIDKKKQEVTKEVTIKIDKEMPNVSLNGSKNIVSNQNVSVCATCTDSLSGCQQGKVCRSFSTSAKNQVITVSDNAGNRRNTETFNVTINKITQPCELKIASDGTVSATLREAATYYGFNSNYTGNNELSKKITINVSRAGESRAQIVNYYVKNKNGNTGSCYIVAIKQCACLDKTRTDASCPTICTFTSQ